MEDLGYILGVEFMLFAVGDKLFQQGLLALDIAHWFLGLNFTFRDFKAQLAALCQKRQQLLVNPADVDPYLIQ